MPIKIENSPEFQVHKTIFSVPLMVKAPRVVDSTAARRQLKASVIGSSVGCYIFAVLKGTRYHPWYVGKATQSFSQEVFNDGNCKKFCEALGLSKTGGPVVSFISPPPKRGVVNKTAIDKLETMLVEECGGQNPEIRNQRKSRIYRTIIHGIVNSGQGKPSNNAQAVKKMMGRT